MDLKKKWAELYAACTNSDQLTWVTHWLVAFIPALLVGGLIHPIAGMVVARAILVVFAVREGMDWMEAYHNPAIKDMGPKTRDGVMDMVGPVVSDIIWTCVVIYG